MAPVDRRADSALSPSFSVLLSPPLGSSFYAVTSTVSSCYAGALVCPRIASTCRYSHQMIIPRYRHLHRPWYWLLCSREPEIRLVLDVDTR
ncbi:hypothetical protein CI102_8941 [Trichoderma harzianum]|nr:hypothetical protein CI102_8941 [Trichoderma harzianum]